MSVWFSLSVKWSMFADICLSSISLESARTTVIRCLRLIHARRDVVSDEVASPPACHSPMCRARGRSARGLAAARGSKAGGLHARCEVRQTTSWRSSNDTVHIENLSNRTICKTADT